MDNDPLVLAHAQALPAGTPEGACAYVKADVRDPGKILDEAAHTLDFSRPIALMMLGIIGQFPDSDNPQAIVSRFMNALPSGSYLALSDGTNISEALNRAVQNYNENSAHTYHLRSHERIARFFDGLELVEPGVVTTAKMAPRRR